MTFVRTCQDGDNFPVTIGIGLLAVLTESFSAEANHIDCLGGFFDEAQCRGGILEPHKGIDKWFFMLLSANDFSLHRQTIYDS